MINPRALELARQPENIQEGDLHLLASEIQKYPYAQFLRALHLYGTHKFQPETYQQHLTKTAAYTTDKKILYYLINGRPQKNAESQFESDVTENKNIGDNTFAQESNQAVVTEKSAGNHNNLAIEQSPEADASEKIPDLTEQITTEPEEIQNLGTDVNTEELPVQTAAPSPPVNRILFPGEEDFFDKPVPKIDLEASRESGKLVLMDEKLSGVNSSESTAEQLPDVADNGSTAGTTTVSVKNLANASAESESNTAENLPDANSNQKVDMPAADEKVPVKDLAAQSGVVSAETIGHQQSEVNLQKDIHEENTISPESIVTSLVSAPSEMLKDTDTLNVEDEHRQIINNQNDTNVLSAVSTTPKQLEIQQEPGNDSPTEPSGENFTPEVIIDNEDQDLQNAELLDRSQLSFHGTDEFLRNVKIAEPVQKPETQAPQPSTTFNRHEEEMQRLIAEVEAKMKKSRPAKKNIEDAAEQVAAHTLDFAEHMQLPDDQPAAANGGATMQSEHTVEDSPPEDALQAQDAGSPGQQSGDSAFTGNDFKQEEPGHTDETPENSNVPKFINTWQSWLKLGKTDTPQPQAHQSEVSKPEEKSRTIETFIENNPKISRLREDSDFVVRERDGDIAHLMTETLAKLYVEQKLYAKAIRAFEILAEKHPDRAEHFAGKIREVKELRLGQRPI